MEALLQLADELERREALAASELAEVERLGGEVERVRAEAGAAARFLAELPAARTAEAAESRAAAEARAAAAAAAGEAEAALRPAEERGRDDERLAAARAARLAREALHEAELRVGLALAELARLDAGEAEQRRRGAELEHEASRLAERLAALPRVAREAAAPPEPGLGGLLAWALQVRGGLLVAAAGIGAERESVAREAAELLAAVSGDPFALAGAGGLRERIAGALRHR